MKTLTATPTVDPATSHVLAVIAWRAGQANAPKTPANLNGDPNSFLTRRDPSPFYEES